MSEEVPVKYLLDSNVLIQAYKLYYQPGFHPGFWEWVPLLNNNSFISIDKVYDELSCGNDILSKWVKTRKELFVPFDTKSLFVLPDIREKLNEAGVLDHKINEFMNPSKADSFLIAYAKAHNCTLVTHEEPAGKINAKKKVHIPDVCNALGVKYTTIYEIMRQDKSHCMQLVSK